MICATKSRRNKLYGVPSPTRIQQLTAEIRDGWSPKTRARRSALGSSRVEFMVVSALLFETAKACCDD